MKSSFLSSFAVLALAANAHAAAYSTDFNGFSLGAAVAGQDGWAINAPNINDLSFVSLMGTNAASLGLRAPGFVPATATVGLTHAYGDPFVNAGNTGTSVNFDFLISDSTNTYTNRDIFGVALTGAGDGNLFTVVFTPAAQSGTPESPPDMQWNLSYAVGPYTPGDPTISLTTGVLEGSIYQFDLSFTPQNLTTTDFKLVVSSGASSHTRTGGFTIAPNTVIENFGLTWTPSVDGDAGSNFITIDTLEVVPEPSAAALLGLAGLGLAFRRRRA